MPENRHAHTISQAAEMLGVTPSWLRFGERLGALPPVRRAPNGWRLYTDEDIERLRRLGVGQRKRSLSARSDDE